MVAASPTGMPGSVSGVTAGALGPLGLFFEATGFQLEDYTAWTPANALGFVLLVAGAFEFLNRVVPWLFATSRSIPQRGRHHDVLDATDTVYLAINRLASVPFTYHYLRAAWVWPAIKWAPSEMTLRNTALALPALFVVYDFFYSLFHRALHHQTVYKWVHKHHHRQHAPSRGNTDAVNVHPFEFVVGEYCHLLAVYCLCALTGECHVAAVLVFIVLGGMLASLNHTRLDVRVPWGVYEVRSHDVHHRLPKSNYGQYTQLWDRLLGTFRPYSDGPQGPAASPSAGKLE